MNVLETERLLLRWVELDDAGFIMRLVQEPAWKRYIGDRNVNTPEEARAHVEKSYRGMYARLGFGLNLVADRATGEPHGICGLLKRDSLEDVDLGFAFLESSWGRGYAFEAAAAVMAREPARRGLTRVAAITAPGNAASIRLLGKLGFRFDRETALGVGKPAVNLYLWEAAGPQSG